MKLQMAYPKDRDLQILQLFTDVIWIDEVTDILLEDGVVCLQLNALFWSHNFSWFSWWRRFNLSQIKAEKLYLYNLHARENI